MVIYLENAQMGELRVKKKIKPELDGVQPTLMLQKFIQFSLNLNATERLRLSNFN